MTESEGLGLTVLPNRVSDWGKIPLPRGPGPVRAGKTLVAEPTGALLQRKTPSL